MNLKNYILTMVIILAYATVSAKIASWTIPPNYQNLQRYTAEMYLYQKDGKWGMVKKGGNVVLPPSYDFITPLTNGYALAGTKEGAKHILEAIIAENGNTISLNDKYYISIKTPYFSEDKLVVTNKNGKYGYINPEGEIVVRCQFDMALPFKEGYAPVKKGNYMQFITEDFDRNPSRNTLVVDFHYGEMTAAGCFSNGLAPIAYNTDYALINSQGQKVRKIKEAEFNQIFKANTAPPVNEVGLFDPVSNYTEYVDNGKKGLKQGENLVLIPQFDAFGNQYSDGDIIATLNGGVGVLNINDGEVSIKSTVNGIHATELEVDRKGKIQPITFDCTVPVSLSNYRLLVDDGDGQLKDRSSEFSREGNSFTLRISPSISKNAEKCDTRIVVENDGIILADDAQHYSVNYPIKLRISSPGPSEVRANERDQATVTSRIFNDSNKDVTVTATWSNGQSSSVKIPAHGSKTVSAIFSVTTEHKRDVSIKLSTGEYAHSTIAFYPYF